MPTYRQVMMVTRRETWIVEAPDREAAARKLVFQDTVAIEPGELLAFQETGKIMGGDE